MRYMCNAASLLDRRGDQAAKENWAKELECSTLQRSRQNIAAALLDAVAAAAEQARESP
jgi:hypothetical protein